MSRRHTLVMFVYVTLIFTLLAWRSESAQRHLEDSTYAMCITRNHNVDRLNRFYQGLIAVEEHNPYKATSPRTIAARIALYRSVLLTEAVCGSDPR